MISAPAPACHRVTDASHEGVQGWISARGQIALVACACTGASAFLYLVDPNRSTLYPGCLLHKLTGIYCAGCGATRALSALLHGRVLDALHDNALLIGALPLLAWVALPHLLRAWSRNGWPPVHVNNRQLARNGIRALTLMIGFMVLRNLPGWPFDLLKPLPSHPI